MAKSAQTGHRVGGACLEFENSEGLLSSTASVPANAVSVLSVVENPRAVMAFIQSPQNAASFDRDYSVAHAAILVKRSETTSPLWGWAGTKNGAIAQAIGEALPESLRLHDRTLDEAPRVAREGKPNEPHGLSGREIRLGVGLRRRLVHRDRRGLVHLQLKDVRAARMVE